MSTGLDGPTDLAEAWGGQEPDRYERSAIHDDERAWTESNCYMDLWVELLHGSGRDPAAMLAVCLAADFDGSQWSFAKPDPGDLRDLYGIEVAEINVWRHPLAHVEGLLARGALAAVEVDAYHLPDTAGTTYRAHHAKTTIVPCQVDRGRHRARYLHGTTLHELEGEDLDGLWAAFALPPYAEAVRRVPSWQRPDHRATAVRCARAHLRRRPADNPVERLGAAVTLAVGWLQGDPDAFHPYAFGTCRQAGACAELASDFLLWLGPDRGGAEAARQFRVAATELKALQFALARATHGRRVDLDPPIRAAASAWSQGIDHAVEALGCDPLT